MYSAYKLNKQGFRLHPPSKHQKPAHFWYSSHVQQRCQDNKRWAQLVPVGRVSNLQTVGGTSTLDISPYLQANPLSRCRSQGHKTQGSSCSLELSQLWRPLSPSISSDYSPLWFRQASEGLVTVKFLTPLLGLRLPIINRRGKKWHCGKCLIADSTLFKDSRQWACPSVEGKKKKKKSRNRRAAFYPWRLSLTGSRQVRVSQLMQALDTPGERDSEKGRQLETAGLLQSVKPATPVFLNSALN